MSRIAKSSVQELHRRMDAVAVVEDYIRLEKRSGRYWGRCPFHAGGQEKTPSFTVDPDRKLFYCFGCREGGSIIDFVMEMDKIGFQDAVKNLAGKFGVELVYDGGEEEGNDDYEAEKTRTEALNELYSRTAGTFRYFLTETGEARPALDYLLSRKLSAEIIGRFRLGYAPADRDWLYRFLQSKGYTAEFLDSSGLFSAQYRGKAFFSNRLIFPIADRQGRVVAFGGRVMPGAVQSDGKEPPKYINSRETDSYKKKQVLYAMDIALPEIRRTKTFYLAEGYMDAIALHQAGVANAVATCGTAFTDEQASLLRHWAEKAVLVFDSDEAGQTAAVKGIITCRKNGLACYLVKPDSALENCKDPAEILQKFGPETLKKIMDCTILDFEFLIARGKTLYDIAVPKGKAEAIAVLYPYLDSLDSKTERDACIEAAADEMRADKNAFLNDFERWQRSNNSGRGSPEKSNVEEVPGTGRSIRMNEELFLLTVVSINTDLYPEFRASLDMLDIKDPDAKELFIALEECYIHEESGQEALLSRIDSEELRNFIIERGISPEFRSDSKRDPKKLMEDGIKRIEVKRYRDRISAIGAELRLLERNPGIGAENKISDLIAEKMHVDAKIRELEGK